MTGRLDAVERVVAAPGEDTVTPRLEELEQRLLSEAARAADRARTAEERSGGELARVVERLAAVESALAEPAEDAVTPRLEQLERRLEESAGERARQAEKALRKGLGPLAERLDAVEQALQRADERDAEARLAELERRLEAEVSQADERTRATEGALRDGLASLAGRLSESEAAYAHAGESLRRSIERLGRAVVQADERIAERDAPGAPPAADGFVAFAPTPEGYRLVAVDGAAPAVDDLVDLDGHDGPLRVTRLGASPIPLDDRPCAYLDRVPAA
jgi:hypothetical protein